MLVLRLLSEPAHFQQAVDEGWTVSVYKDSRLILSGHPIEMFNRDTVKIAGTYFSWNNASSRAAAPSFRIALQSNRSRRASAGASSPSFAAPSIRLLNKTKSTAMVRRQGTIAVF